MFEHYLQHQVPDSRRRRRVASSCTVAGFATAGMIGFVWLTNQLAIAQVSPQAGYFVMVHALRPEIQAEPVPEERPRRGCGGGRDESRVAGVRGARAVQLPIAAVRAQAIYAPGPDQNKLGAARAGETRTAFCVDFQGRTTDVRTIKKFPGDPKLDEVSRDTIKRWRFSPFLVEGRPTRICSIQVFNFIIQ